MDSDSASTQKKSDSLYNAEDYALLTKELREHGALNNELEVTGFVGQGNGGSIFRLNDGRLIKLHLHHIKDGNVNNQAYLNEIEKVGLLKGYLDVLASGSNPLAVPDIHEHASFKSPNYFTFKNQRFHAWHIMTEVKGRSASTSVTEKLSEGERKKIGINIAIAMKHFHNCAKEIGLPIQNSANDEKLFQQTRNLIANGGATPDDYDIFNICTRVWTQ